MQSIDDVSMSSGNINPSHAPNADPLHESWATYLDAMIPSQSNQKTSMPAPQQRPMQKNKSDVENTASPPNDPSFRPGMFSAGQNLTGVSQMSMISDMTGLSCYDDKSMRSLAMKAQKAFKSDASMAMSEMSEAMASLDMSMRK